MVPDIEVSDFTPAPPTTQSIKEVIVMYICVLCVKLFGRL